MQDGTASHTARSVAACRLTYDRVAAVYGDPAADEALSRDIADGLTPRSDRIREYLRVRTAFFDRVVVNAVDRRITQVVTGGAGYDGRAFRYARPGVRWFEVDHPATQADKRARVARLGLDASHIAFIPADFTAAPVAGPLRDAGLDPARPALFLFEGVAVYLDRPVIERVLAEFREVTAADSRLAVSVSTGTSTPVTRARFQARVAEMGEPARTVLTVDEAAGLLAAAGWQVREPSDRQRSAGLLLAHAAAAHRGTERGRGTPAPPASLAGAVPPAGPAAALPLLPATAAEVARLPLSALLSQALVAFTIEADNEAEHRLPHRTTDDGAAPGAPAGAPWLTSLLMWANCLRHLPDEGITVAELGDRARTGTNLDGMRRWRYVTFTPDPGHGKRPRPDAVIAPTRWGIVARDTWHEVTAQVESRWQDRLGADAFGALRAALAGVVARLDPALPDCLPILGYGLYSSRDPAEPASRAKRPPAGPPARHPSPRGLAVPASSPAGTAPAPSSAAVLPLWALLSRTLLAFAAQYEAAPGPSLAVSANVLRVLTGAGAPASDIPARGGVSKESVAMAAGWLRGSGLATEGPDPAGGRRKVTTLTPRGVTARDGYPVKAADVERDWCARFGDATVTALRRSVAPLLAGDPPPLAAGLAPYPDNWRARRPPPVTLPHYPMTLHRGGYPDGS
jgi:methyltransferase (TIGR00027 family)